MDAATSAQKLKTLFADEAERAPCGCTWTPARAAASASRPATSTPRCRRPATRPWARAEVIRKVFKRYFKLEGKIAPWLGEALPWTTRPWTRFPTRPGPARAAGAA